MTRGFDVEDQRKEGKVFALKRIAQLQSVRALYLYKNKKSSVIDLNLALLNLTVSSE